MSHHIVAFLVIDETDKSSYPSARRGSNFDEFLDIYRRCLAIFYLSARRANPDARLYLFQNKVANSVSTESSAYLDSLCTQLGVEVILTEFRTLPSPGLRNWLSQFFVFDVLSDLASRVTSGHVLIMDSDVVWASRDATPALWDKMKGQLAVMDSGHPEQEEINGSSSGQLSAIFGRQVRYFGGEFISADASYLRGLHSTALECLEVLGKNLAEGRIKGFEEAHVLSAAYSIFPFIELSSRDIKRMWTQPFKYRNVVPGDEEATLWHTPGEKRFGLRRLFQTLMMKEPRHWIEMPDDEWVRLLSDQLGVPRNSFVKIVSDVSFAAKERLREHLSRPHL